MEIDDGKQSGVNFDEVAGVEAGFRSGGAEAANFRAVVKGLDLLAD